MDPENDDIMLDDGYPPPNVKIFYESRLPEDDFREVLKKLEDMNLPYE